MVKDGYKEVKALGEKYIIPEEWSLKELNEVLTVIRNGSSKKQNKQGKGLPVSRIETIADGTINYDKIGYVDLGSEDLKKHKLEKGDILFSHINSIAHIGKVAQYKADKKLYHGMNLLKLRFDNEKVTDQFMLHRLKSVNAKHFYERYAKQAVNQASLNQNDVGLYTFPLPPLPEQKKISSILSSVDKSIEKTDEVIEKTKELKKGLMQELLTKGIWHSEFKEVRIGVKKYDIPNKWEVKKLEECCEISYGKDQSGVEEENGDYPILGTGGLIGYANDYLYDKESVLIGRKGTIDKPQYMETPFWTIDTLFYTNDFNETYPKWLYYYLNYYDLSLLNEATGVPSLNRNNLYNLDLPYPPLEEQKKIASILSSVDAKIQKEEEYKAKLERLKKGLMQKLLTGEIRVNTDMEV